MPVGIAKIVTITRHRPGHLNVPIESQCWCGQGDRVRRYNVDAARGESHILGWHTVQDSTNIEAIGPVMRSTRRWRRWLLRPGRLLDVPAAEHRDSNVPNDGIQNHGVRAALKSEVWDVVYYFVGRWISLSIHLMNHWSSIQEPDRGDLPSIFHRDNSNEGGRGYAIYHHLHEKR